MKTSECFCADTAALPPDPRKHVNYTQGMVLGVDDLVQDFAYHRHQRQWLARDAIGYGTLSGLQVAAEDVPGKGLQITVTPGTALSPRGHLLRVAPKQCAAINAWLALEETKSALAELAVPGTPRVHVALCFRDCAVDPLPVPGEPCRCEDQTTAASRTLDDFELKLRLDPPPRQREEETLREFVKWLRRVHGTGATNDAAGRTKVLEWIRKMARDAADNSTK